MGEPCTPTLGGLTDPAGYEMSPVLGMCVCVCVYMCIWGGGLGYEALWDLWYLGLLHALLFQANAYTVGCNFSQISSNCLLYYI